MADNIIDFLREKFTRLDARLSQISHRAHASMPGRPPIAHNGTVSGGGTFAEGTAAGLLPVQLPEVTLVLCLLFLGQNCRSGQLFADHAVDQGDRDLEKLS